MTVRRARIGDIFDRVKNNLTAQNLISLLNLSNNLARTSRRPASDRIFPSGHHEANRVGRGVLPSTTTAWPGIRRFCSTNRRNSGSWSMTRVTTIDACSGATADRRGPVAAPGPGRRNGSPWGSTAGRPRTSSIRSIGSTRRARGARPPSCTSAQPCSGLSPGELDERDAGTSPYEFSAGVSAPTARSARALTPPTPSSSSSRCLAPHPGRRHLTHRDQVALAGSAVCARKIVLR